jgi:DNA invertase Pin-like site-specific DNA recombinase
MNQSRADRLRTLAADLAELERRNAQQRISAAIAEAKRRKIPPGPNFLKPYQLDAALRRIGQGEAVWSVANRLRCASNTLYRAIAAVS